MPLFALLPLLMKVLKFTVLFVVLVLVAAAAFLWWASGGQDAREDAEWRVLETEETPGEAVDAPAPDAPLVVLSWNMAYGRGPKDDAGDLRSRETVETYLDAIADAIQRSGAQVVALQEVDFEANRTHRIDQVAYLLKKLGWRYAARATTWQNRYVPFPYWPPSQHYGAMHSGQAVLSQLPITRNARLRYPQPEAWAFWYKAFYLNRATQVVDVKVGERTVTLLNTHLEAFEKTNRELQARRLSQLVEEERAKKDAQRAVLVLGDFNAPPAEATKKQGFEDEPDMDFSGDETIAIMRELRALDEVVTRDAAKRGEAHAWTFPAEAPTRQLDYLFYDEGVILREGRVWREAGPNSDHLPIRAEFDFADN